MRSSSTTKFSSLALLLSLLVTSAHPDEALRKKIGQMIVVGFVGSAIPDSLYRDLSFSNLGGVVLSTGNGNLISPAQILQLTTQIRNVSLTPPFIAVDEEGGNVARLSSSNGFATTYTAYTLGTTFASLDSTRKQAAMMASWLKITGMNLNFAPVADVNVNPASPAIGYFGRSFSSNPFIVAAHDQVFVDEFHAAGIITTLKHYPGHGSAGTDSHLTLPDITTTWSSSELIPYQELMKTNSLDVVMVGHLYNATIDSLYPSSLSTQTVQGLLRDSLGYQGVVITDDLYNMKAITDYYGFYEAAELAVNAGVDILLYVNNTYKSASLCRQLVDTLEARVMRGVISEARIDEAFERISRLKSQYNVTGVSGPLASGHLIPADFRLVNYPNPFNPSTTIRFSLPVAGEATVKVYDVLGRELETLIDGRLTAGEHEVRWNAFNRASGVYFCRLQSEGVNETRKLLLRR